MRAALYARVSTTEQTTTNQLIDLRQYVSARRWQDAVEYVDEGVSGSKDSRPALDRLVSDARRRRADVLVVWKLDRLGRSLRHLILLLDELTALGVAFVSLGEGIDTSTPAGRLQLPHLREVVEREHACTRLAAVVPTAHASANTAARRLPGRTIHSSRRHQAAEPSARPAALNQDRLVGVYDTRGLAGVRNACLI